MHRKLISVSVLLLVVVLLATSAPSCGGEEPEAAPTPPTSGTGHNFLIEVTTPDNAVESEWARITVDVTCIIDWVTMTHNLQAGTVGICFPYLVDEDEIELLTSNIKRYEKYESGEEVTTNYCHGDNINAPYPILEAYEPGWEEDVKKTIDIQVRPRHAGTFTFFVKAYGTVFVEGHLLSVYEPLSGIKDEQNEYVQVYEFEVAASG